MTDLAHADEFVEDAIAIGMHFLRYAGSCEGEARGLWVEPCSNPSNPVRRGDAWRMGPDRAAAPSERQKAPHQMKVSAYTFQGMLKMLKDVAELRKLGLPTHQFRRRARAIMLRQKLHDRPIISAYIKNHGIPEL